MGKCVQWSVAVMLLLTMIEVENVFGQNVVFPDDIAGQHINFLSDKGIKLLLRARGIFMARLSALSDSVNQMENVIASNYSTTSMPDMKSYMENKLSEVTSKIDLAGDMLNDLNLTEPDDGDVYFYKSSNTEVDNKDAHDPGNRAGGTFTAPQHGLYKVVITNIFTVGFTSYLMKNGDVTLATLSTADYFETKTRVVLCWLDEGDEIFTTGSIPPDFGVVLVRMKTLVPHRV